MTLLLVALLALLAGLAAGVVLGSGLLRRHDSTTADHVQLSAHATAQAVGPVKESLDRFDTRLRELESSRIAWHSQLREQVEQVRATSESLRRETAALSTALRKPQVRGRWGEMHLQRAAELAGMVERCDFDLQTTVRDDGAALRPDMVVHLAGNKQVVVDSKVPLDAFLDSTEAEDDDERAAHLARHARQLRSHVDGLAAKTYWRQFSTTPEFVVLFVPGEAFLSAALETDRALIDDAAAKRVVLATPTTLIALLRTVAFAWGQAQLADEARQVHELARELYDRLGTLGAHVGKVGRSLDSAVKAYNNAVGSLETRVLVTARKMSELHAPDTDLAAPAPVETLARPLQAPELVDPLVDEIVSAEVARADVSRPGLARADASDPHDGSARRTG
ncbi:DNA recombination protein RmuC [Mumia sp. Pv 4-285]|uniref:DNA recombination protein RmuC n=1 Tax=Mumia qirimensis TaxID=3234852 RepID=UPI00351D0838